MEAEAPQNPLELTTALLFAFSFLAVTAITHFILRHYPQQGLQWMALFTGFTDIDPFILALVGGQLPAALPDIGQAILIAAASNNLLKAGYVAILGAGATRWLAGLGLAGLAIATLVTSYLLVS